MPCVADIVSVDDVILRPSNGACPPAVGTPVLCYIDDIGPIDGIAAAIRLDGFTLQVVASDERRARTAARLSWLRRADDRPDQRAATRIVPAHRDVRLQVLPGLVVQATVADLSMTGAALAIPRPERPQIGAAITVGKRFARVVRHTPEGVGVAFRLPFGPMTFNERVIL